MSLGSEPLLLPLRFGVANVLSDRVVVCCGECFLCLLRYFNKRTTKVMMMTMKMMHPDAIPANKATSEPSILECPALLPSVLDPEWSFTKGLVVELFPLVPASCSGRLVGSVCRGCPAELGSCPTFMRIFMVFVWHTPPSWLSRPSKDPFDVDMT